MMFSFFCGIKLANKKYLVKNRIEEHELRSKKMMCPIIILDGLMGT